MMCLSIGMEDMVIIITIIIIGVIRGIVIIVGIVDIRITLILVLIMAVIRDIGARMSIEW
jgi:hypothetical protein